MIERFHHSERRYLVPHVFRSAVEAMLSDILPPGRTYGVETVYVDTPERSWSLMSDSTLPKMRVRTYGSGESFYEKKLHNGSDTNKERVPVTGIPDGLTAIGSTRYTRTEHELSGIRVTIDRDVSMNEIAFDMLIVEVKGELPKTIRFLLSFEDKRFSKYKALSGKWTKETE